MYLPSCPCRLGCRDPHAKISPVASIPVQGMGISGVRGAGELLESGEVGGVRRSCEAPVEVRRAASWLGAVGRVPGTQEALGDPRER